MMSFRVLAPSSALGCSFSFGQHFPEQFEYIHPYQSFDPSPGASSLSEKKASKFLTLGIVLFSHFETASSG